MKIKCLLWTSQVINVTIVDIACIVALLFRTLICFALPPCPTKCLITRFAERLHDFPPKMYLFWKSTHFYELLSFFMMYLECKMVEKWKMMRCLPSGYKFYTLSSHAIISCELVFTIFFLLSLCLLFIASLRCLLCGTSKIWRISSDV